MGEHVTNVEQYLNVEEQVPKCFDYFRMHSRHFFTTFLLLYWKIQ